MSLNFELARHNMVEQQVRPWDVLDSRVLEALTALRREDFVPSGYRNLAFADLALPLAHGGFMLKPVIEGRILQAVAPTRAESALEIGTGAGFLTACLARLSGTVHSIEAHADLADAARARLRDAGVANATVEVADAMRDYRPAAAFDVVVATGAVYAVPPHWREWVKPGGRLFAVIGDSPVQRAVLLTRADDGAWSEQGLFETDLPYLDGAAPPRRFVL